MAGLGKYNIKKKKKKKVEPNFDGVMPKYYTGVQEVNVPTGGGSSDVISGAAGGLALGQQAAQFAPDPYSKAAVMAIGAGAGIYKGFRDKGTKDIKRARAINTNANIQNNTYNQDPYAYQAISGYKKGTQSMKIPKYQFGTQQIGAATGLISGIGQFAGASPEQQQALDLVGQFGGAIGGLAMPQGVPQMEQGGEVPSKTIEVEKGELKLRREKNGQFKLLRNYNGEGYDRHSEGGEMDEGKEGDIIIPRGKAKKVLNYFKGGDRSTKVGSRTVGNAGMDIEDVVSQLPKDNAAPQYVDGTDGINPFNADGYDSRGFTQDDYDRLMIGANRKGQDFDIKKWNKANPGYADWINNNKDFNDKYGGKNRNTNIDPSAVAYFRNKYTAEDMDKIDPRPINIDKPTVNRELTGKIDVDPVDPYYGREINIPNPNLNKIGEVLPTAYNLGMGLFGNVDTLDMGRYNPQEQQYRDLSERDRQAANEGSAVARYNMGKRHMSRGQGIGEASNIERQRQGAMGRINQAENRRYDQIAAGNTNIRNQADLTNLGFQQQETMYGKQAEGKKSEYLGRGLEGAAGLSQNALQRDMFDSRLTEQRRMDMMRLKLQEAGMDGVQVGDITGVDPYDYNYNPNVRRNGIRNRKNGKYTIKA